MGDEIPPWQVVPPDLEQMLRDGEANPASMDAGRLLLLEAHLFAFARDLVLEDVPMMTVREAVSQQLLRIRKRFWELGLDDSVIRARTASLLAALTPERKPDPGPPGPGSNRGQPIG